MEDTIVAISTALGKGAIAIIRLSGKDSINIVNSVFSGADLTKVASHTINYGFIEDNGKKIDEVLVSVMKAPKTFTTEDVVEINSHGGIIATQKILELMLKKGARQAEAGEFTKRAFLNGRIDLTEAESVMDIIDSKSNEAMELAMKNLTGSTKNLIENFRNDLLEILSNIEVNIDYPEYEDIEVMTIEDIKQAVKNMEDKLSKILKESKNTKFIKEGINTVIVGRPNAGKSSILNKLLEEEKAIVTDIAGTTRDIVEGTISINGIVLNMIDTAGIRETEDIIENIGVEKSLKIMDEADLILFMLNNNEEVTNDLIELSTKLVDKKYLILINKNDLETKLDITKLNIDKDKIINLSIINNKGIDELKDKITELFKLNELETQDPTYLSNTRSISILKNCLKKTEEIEESLKNNLPIDMIELDIKSIWEELGKINGSTYEEELLDEMFKRFCLGK